jgi:hypothetical protein
MGQLAQDRFRIFVSHKHADERLADVVAEELEGLAPDLISCWVSGQDLLAGADWNRTIKANLAGSHLLLLLFTTPAHTWDWCLFEVGLFMRFFEEDVSSVVCLFEPDGTAPGPLSHVQGVQAEADQLLSRFLEPLCTETWRVSDGWQRGALVPNPDQEQLAKAARRIARAFHKALGGDEPGDSVYSYRPCHRVVLDLEPADRDVEWTGIPLDARVVEGTDDTSSYTLGLFRLHEGKGRRTWRDLVAEVDGEDAPWRHDLDRAFTEGLRSNLWEPSTNTLEAWRPGGGGCRTYLPVLYQIDRRVDDDRPVRATVLLLPIL